jgi:hypothetical protein
LEEGTNEVIGELRDLASRIDRPGTDENDKLQASATAHQSS